VEASQVELTHLKQALLERLNNEAEAEHKALSKKAESFGKRAPEKPAPLTEMNIEFPKWLHKGLKTEKTHSLKVPEESVLVKTPEEAKEYLAKGYSEEPAKSDAPAKKEASKKE